MNPFYPLVAERAKHRCEYCHAPEIVFNFPFEVEHIIPVSKAGMNEETNLALACRSCNLNKGSLTTGKLEEKADIPLFHPRLDLWSEHFLVSIASGEMLGLSDIGKVTINCLKINASSQVKARQLWIKIDVLRQYLM